jgi:hypothetical protein
MFLGMGQYVHVDGLLKIRYEIKEQGRASKAVTCRLSRKYCLTESPGCTNDADVYERGNYWE